jgi:hypothetical protein
VDASQTAFAAVADLATALRRAEAAHGVARESGRRARCKLAGWYADYIAAEQGGRDLPQ